MFTFVIDSELSVESTANTYLLKYYLEQKENPQTICNQIGFCSSNPSIHYKYDFCNLGRDWINLEITVLELFKTENLLLKIDKPI